MTKTMEITETTPKATTGDDNRRRRPETRDDDRGGVVDVEERVLKNRKNKKLKSKRISEAEEHLVHESIEDTKD